MQARLDRLAESDYQTEGIFIFGDFSVKTLELPWRDNQRRISRIPKGTYNVVRHQSPRFGECFLIKDVPERSHILIHAGNFYSDTLGCVLVGKEFIDINGDGQLDVNKSRLAMNELLENLPDDFELKITERFLK